MEEIMIIPDKVYDVLKIVVWIAPGLLAFVCGIINAIQTGDIIAIVTAVIGGLGTLAGGLLTKSCEDYKKESQNGDHD